MSDSTLSNRQKKLLLFDVDGTLTVPRGDITPEMFQVLKNVREKVYIGFVGGSDWKKIKEQLTLDGSDPLDLFDYGFAENGVMAFKGRNLLSQVSFIQQLGEEKYKKLVNFILHYIADMDIPIKRGTFIEFRMSMVNVSPIGRNATVEERQAFEEYDKKHQLRATFVRTLQEKFPDYGLTFAIGGQISFDIFPHGWDKTYCLKHVENDEYEEIHFFGDKTWKGGNDYEIFSDPRTIGHAVTSPHDTARILKELVLKDS
ncbi:Phosphomannomutase 1 [Clathrus columnatus]|uniref:Phosphomannomutase n=1 Tax=Clathrus columnatus TaxID=1419009 RepID=A0AAV5A4T8_9AGAM|nr:Phosphomannomutase 1 [Clathrus columnatus]